MKMKQQLKSLTDSLARFLITLAVITAPFLSLGSTQAHAQDLSLDREATAVSGALSTMDLDIPILLRYVGTGSAPAGGTVTAVAATSITLKTGAVGASTADATTECPVSGALGGVIDLTHASCNTWGEVCDAINLPNSNWRCVIMDALRTDASATNLAKSETSATDPAGVPIYTDSSVAFTATMALTPERTMAAFLTGPDFRFHPDPYRGFRYKFLAGSFTSTYGSGTSSIDIYSVKHTINPTTGKSAETVTTLWSQAGGATTAEKVLNFYPGGIYAKKGEKLLVRVNNSAAMTAVSAYSYGYGIRYN
jgi:hypothetical protein